LTSEEEFREPRKPHIGVLAYGSLIDDPGSEIRPAIIHTISNVTTPFSVEFARASKTRGGGPTLVPVIGGGAPVKAVIHQLSPDVTLAQAKDWVWRRETGNIGTDKHYDEFATGKNRVRVIAVEHFHDLRTVLYTHIGANIAPLTADELARRAIASAQSPTLADGEDGISYLARVMAQGIATPLTYEYQQAILQRTQTTNLAEAIEFARATREARADNAAVGTTPSAGPRPAQVPTEVHGDAFPILFQAFERLLGTEIWDKRAAVVDQEIENKPLFDEYLRNENRIVLTLRNLSVQTRTLGRLPALKVQTIADYETYGLVTQFMSLYSALPARDSAQLLGRLKGAFKNPDDLRGLLFELLIATHFVKRGFSVEFPAESEGKIPDFLATRDGVTCDVECKSISINKGRQIHRKDALAINSMLLEICKPQIRQLNNGLLVHATVPARLPTSKEERELLCRNIHGAIVIGQDLIQPDLEVRLHKFDPATSPIAHSPPDPAAIAQYFESRFGIVNRELAIFFSSSGRAIAFVLDSKTPDRTVEATIETVKAACDDQLSGNRAGVICVKFEDLSAHELSILGDEAGPPSALRIATSHFLNSRKSSHLVNLAYFADGSLERIEPGVMVRRGQTYFFENKDSPYYNATVLSAFKDPAGGMD
jgi:cation transport regulator ChaC